MYSTPVRVEMEIRVNRISQPIKIGSRPITQIDITARSCRVQLDRVFIDDNFGVDVQDASCSEGIVPVLFQFAFLSFGR